MRSKTHKSITPWKNIVGTSSFMVSILLIWRDRMEVSLLMKKRVSSH